MASSDVRSRQQRNRNRKTNVNRNAGNSEVRPEPKITRKIGHIDTTFLILLLMILTVGTVMLFSASSVYADHYRGDSFYYIKKQIQFIVLGLIAMYILSLIDYRYWEKLTWPIYFAAMGLVALAIIMNWGDSIKRWIYLGPFQFQPSEIAKFALILAVSNLIIKFGDKKMHTLKYGVLYIGAAAAPLVGLVLGTSHLSATILLLGITATIMLVGGTQLRWFILAAIVAAVGVYMIIYTDLISYSGERIELWLDPFNVEAGYQTKQSLLAISSGGVLGMGLGNSRQKYLYVPEPQNDFIFSIVCEELGFVGATIIILMFCLLIWRGFTIAMRSADVFGSLITVGIIGQIALQTFLNIAVVTNTIPNTGISLPFFSAGGTSLIVLLAEVGIVLSVSRHSRVDKS